MGPLLCIGVDVGRRSHHVGIAQPDGAIIEEFQISHCNTGFHELFQRVEAHRCELSFHVAAAMEGCNGYARPLDRLVLGED